MPNWCTNSLTASGDPARVAELVAAVRTPGEPLSLAAIVPQPASAGDGGYGWRLEWWGTKWDVTQVASDVGVGEAQWRFATAWAPPLTAVAVLSLRFPDVRLHLEFSEPGNAVAGTVTFAGGLIVEEVDIDEQWPDFDEDPEGKPTITETPVDVDAARDAVRAAVEGNPAAHTAGAVLDALLRAAPAERLWQVIDVATAGVARDALVRLAAERVLAGRPVPLLPVLLHHDDDELRRVAAALFGLSPLLSPPDPMRSLMPLAAEPEAAPALNADELVALVTGDTLTAETVAALAPDWTGDMDALLATVRSLAARS